MLGRFAEPYLHRGHVGLAPCQSECLARGQTRSTLLPGHTEIALLACLLPAAGRRGCLQLAHAKQGREELFRKAAELRRAQEALDAEIQRVQEQTGGLSGPDKDRLAGLLDGTQGFTELPQGAKDILAGAGVLQDLDWRGEAALPADTYLQRTSPAYNVEGAGKEVPPEGGDGSEYQAWTQQQSEQYLQDLLKASRVALGEAGQAEEQDGSHQYEGMDDDEYFPQENEEVDQSAEDVAEVERFLNLLADGHDLPPDPRTEGVAKEGAAEFQHRMHLAKAAFEAQFLKQVQWQLSPEEKRRVDQRWEAMGSDVEIPLEYDDVEEVRPAPEWPEAVDRQYRAFETVLYRLRRAYMDAGSLQRPAEDLLSAGLLAEGAKYEDDLIEMDACSHWPAFLQRLASAGAVQHLSEIWGRASKDWPDPEWTVVADVIYSFPEPAWYQRFTQLQNLGRPPAPQTPKARRGRRERVDVDSLKGDELDMALAEAIMHFQEKNEAALKERSPPAWPEDPPSTPNWADEWLQQPIVSMLNKAANKTPADKNAEDDLLQKLLAMDAEPPPPPPNSEPRQRLLTLLQGSAAPCRADPPNSPPRDIGPEDEQTWSRHMVVPGDSLWETSSAAVALAKKTMNVMYGSGRARADKASKGPRTARAGRSGRLRSFVLAGHAPGLKAAALRGAGKKPATWLSLLRYLQQQHLRHEDVSLVVCTSSTHARSRMKPPPGLNIQTWPLFTCSPPTLQHHMQQQQQEQSWQRRQRWQQQPHQHQDASAPGSSRPSPAPCSAGSVLSQVTSRKGGNRRSVPVLVRSFASRFLPAGRSGISEQQQEGKQEGKALPFPLLSPPLQAQPGGEEAFMELLMTVTFHVDGKRGKVTKVHSMLDRLEAPQLHSRQDAVDIYMRQSGLFRHCDNIAHQSMA